MTDQQAPQTTEPTTAIVPNRMQGIREGIGAGEPVALVPRTIGEVQALAGMLAASSLVPQPLRDRPADVAMMLMTGAELRMGPASALRLLYVDRNGIPRLMAGGKSALVRRSNVCEYLKPDPKNDANRATWYTKRRGEEEQSRTFTIEQAKAAGFYPGKPESAWSRFPDRMLSARAKAWLCDDIYPDVVAGMYEADEVDDLDFAAVDTAPRFSAPPPPASGPSLSVVPPPTDEKPIEEKPSKNSRKTKPKTDTSDATDAEVISETSGGKTAAQIKAEQEKAAQDEAFRKAREGAAAIDAQNAAAAERAREGKPSAIADATPASTTTTAQSAPAATTVDDGGFGDDEPASLGPTNVETYMDGSSAKCRALPGHDGKANFDKFVRELNAVANDARKEDEIKRVKAAWIPWSKVGSAGAEFAQAMREAFTKRSTELAS